MSEVARIRETAGLTQRELAHASGVAQPNLAAYETGQQSPSATMLEQLRAAARPRPSVILHAHKAEVERIARRHKARQVRVFGSVARGDDRPESDIDLLVTFEPGASLFDQVGLVQDLEELLGVHVDVVSEGGLGPGHDSIRSEARAL